MKTKKITLFLIALLVMGCADELAQEDITPQSVEINSLAGTVGGNAFNTSCDPNYKFSVFSLGDIGYKAISIYYDPSLSADEVRCVRYDFFHTYDRLKMGIIQPNEIHKEIWYIPENPTFPYVFPNRLNVSDKVEVETAICVDPRTESEDCDDDDVIGG